MAKLVNNYASVVVLGRQNPQILNVDFLKQENIIPTDKPPFVKYMDPKKPFSGFLSTPPLAQLIFDNITFLVEENRFQIKEESIGKWTDTHVISIAEKYYETLQYTPNKVVGVNINSAVIFKSQEEASRFQELFIKNDCFVFQTINEKNMQASSVFRFFSSTLDGRITLAFNQLVGLKRDINFNYEFDYQDLSNFKEELKKYPKIVEYSQEVITNLINGV